MFARNPIFVFALAFAGVFLTANALPTVPMPLAARVETKGVATPISAQTFASFKPFSQFARAAYCPTDKIMNWKCGEACEALPDFVPMLNGGDGNGVQFYFVGHWPSQKAVICSHQGTDPTQFLSLLTDIDFLPESLDPELFPGVPADVRVHGGFKDAHADTAKEILAETKRLIAEKGAKNVILIGHSLGGAIAELDTLMMRLNLPADITVKGVTYGTPRVGAPSFVDFFDGKIDDFSRVNNDNDPIPIVPGRFLGFAHPKGEVHIVDDGSAVACPGDDNAEDDNCSNQVVSNLLKGNILDHLGPYEGVHMGTIFCT